MKPEIAIIIPYYQTEAGILQKAVQSVLTQKDIVNFEIIVVDDGAPISASDELTDIVQEYANVIKIIHQENGGAGAARNTGLNHVSESCKYVAFLDSDDSWFDFHLSNAIAALDLGYDFYFSDFYFSDYKEKSVFERAAKIPLSEHELLVEERNIYEYCGNMIDQILVKGNVIGTSNVVYRFDKFPDIRFREEFYNGQDYLFWLDFANLSNKVVFSSNIECDCGEGINIYCGAGWGTERSLQRSMNELKLWRYVGKNYATNKQRRTSNHAKVNNIRMSLTRDILHRITHRKKISAESLRKILNYDVAFFFLFPFCLLSIIKDKLFK